MTAGLGIEPHVARFEAANDDYSAILLKALADRLAEGLAELMHARVRREFWGYAQLGEALDNEALIDERYVGIRPAPGYPACPDHTVKRGLFDLLDAPAIGMTLTESYAMLRLPPYRAFILTIPTAVTSGWARSAATRCRAMPPAAASAWSRPSVTWRRTWVYPA